MIIADPRTTTIRRRLIGDLVLLIVIIGGTIFAATWISGARTVRELSTALIERTADQTAGELENFFGTVTSQVLIGRSWGERGMLSATDYEAMNDLFVPILQDHPEMSSMMVADSNGAEYLLLRRPLTPHEWENRIVEADRRGTDVVQRSWNSQTGKVNSDDVTLAYDPRTRIWYEKALLTTNDKPVFWTKPVIFFVTKDPGITASTHLQTDESPPRTIVVAFDLLLMDISKFTVNANVSRRGKVFVFAESQQPGQFQVVGLPQHERFATDDEIKKTLAPVANQTMAADSDAQLPSPQELQIPSVTAVMQAWLEGGRPDRPLKFTSAGENWWGGFRPFPLGDNTFWIAVIVPEQDLSANIGLQQLMLVAIVLGVFALGTYRAILLARRFGRPIESLVEQSERISQGDLQPGPPIRSNISEIRRLADAHDNMREGLKAVIKLEKLERDLDIAREIQRGLLPAQSPDTPGFEVAGWNRPADQTGGDYFDWLTLPDGRTLFTLADVTGHGIGPALIVSVYRAYIRAAAGDNEVAITEVVSRVNDLLCGDIPDGRFITAVVGMIRPADHQVRMLSAGQAPLLFYEVATDTVHNWDADDFPLGIAEGMDFSGARHISFAAGDMLVLTTDGFFEAANSAGEQFGIEALVQFIRTHHELSPDEFIQKLYQTISTHAAGEPQGDDLTALVIKRNGAD